MKILYAIQGTGNGHVCRASEIIPYLRGYGDLDLLISGTQVDIPLNWELKYKLYGFSFIFGQKGGVNQWRTFKNMRLKQLFNDIKKLPLHKYDIIINDFEPVVAWACKLRNISCLGLSHQYSFLSKKTPRPQTKMYNWQEYILKYYAPVKQAVGFHFKPYDNYIQTPIIRKDIRRLKASENEHYTVYLPAYHDAELIKYFIKLENTKWEIFSKHSSEAYVHKNVKVYPVDNDKYIKSMASSRGIITGGGFEAPAEALYLGKKILCIPMKGQWEQQCNAEALRRMDVPVITSINYNFVERLKEWTDCSRAVKINYPDNTKSIINQLITNYKH